MVADETSLDEGVGEFASEFVYSSNDDSAAYVRASDWGSGSGRDFLLSLFFKCVCHMFFISLSVRPGNLDAITDHLHNIT